MPGDALNQQLAVCHKAYYRLRAARTEATRLAYQNACLRLALTLTRVLRTHSVTLRLQHGRAQPVARVGRVDGQGVLWFSSTAGARECERSVSWREVELVEVRAKERVRISELFGCRKKVA